MTHSLRSWVRTPKGQLTILLVPLLLAAGARSGGALVAPMVAASVAAGMLVDLPLIRWRTGRWSVPDGAALTGLIVAMVLSPHTSWRVAASTTAVGVAAKYPLRAGHANVLNPAAAGLVAAYYLFGAGESWWGALAELPLAWIVLPVVVGAYTVDHNNKAPAALAFLGSYFALLTAQAFLGDPAPLAEVYRAPDLHAAVFFAAFMVTDPPTSPPKPRDQVAFGLITGTVAWLAFTTIGAVWWLPGGLLVANLWEGWRKVRLRRRRAATGATPPRTG